MGVRARYTILYGTMVLVSGLGLLAIVGALGFRSTRSAPAQGWKTPAAEQIAHLQQQLADSDQAHSRQLVFGLVTGLVVTVLLSMLLGRFLAGRVLRPLRVITAATRRITADNLHERLAVPGPADEVKALADTIDELLGRLEESFAAQRRFVADASHELRTPLATMRASVDVAMAKPGPVPAGTAVLADRVRSSLDDMERLLEGLLLLARAQHSAFDDREAVSLTALASQALKDKPEDLMVYASLPPDVVTLGSPVLLARLVGNVIDNALRHNVPGGWVRVTVSESSPAWSNGATSPAWSNGATSPARSDGAAFPARLNDVASPARLNDVASPARFAGVASRTRLNGAASPARTVGPVASALSAGSARLVVESTGQVLDPAQVARLGRPFQRLGAERTGPGTGLGLSIVAAVASAHGGAVSLEARPTGGLIVTVDLPLAVAAPA
jgi:signal transduction histidine kinase